MGVWSFALAFTISSFINVGLLLFYLYKQISEIDSLYDLLYKINRISIASFMMGLALYIPMKIFDEFVFDTTKTIDLIILTVVVTAFGLVAFIILGKIFKFKELDYISVILSKTIVSLKRS